MKFCSKCGQQINDEAVICVHCGCAVPDAKSNETRSYETNEPDEVNVGLCVLSALLPIFGLIYWPVKHSTTPKKAKACGVTSIIAWVVFFIIELLIINGGM